MDKSRPRSVLLPALSTDPELVDTDFFWEAHWKKVVAALVVVVVGILAVGGWAYYRADRSASAAALYSVAESPESWREVTEKYPGSIAAGNALMRMATALRAEGKDGEAAAEFEKFATSQPDHPLAGAAWLAIGEIKQAQKDTPGALESYRIASGRYQSSYAAPLALLAEARLLAAEGKAGESKAIIESIGTSYPDGPAAMVAAAELGALTGQQPATDRAP